MPCRFRAIQKQCAPETYRATISDVAHFFRQDDQHSEPSDHPGIDMLFNLNPSRSFTPFLWKRQFQRAVFIPGLGF